PRHDRDRSEDPKWAILAPIFLPLMLRLGVAPQTVLAAYRVGRLADQRADAADAVLPVDGRPLKRPRYLQSVVEIGGALLLQLLRFVVVGGANTLLSWCVYA